jgi:hypothetical protein
VSDTAWQTIPAELEEDDRLISAVLDLHDELYSRFFSGDPLVNPELGIRIRAFRRTGNWRIFLLLTPWMLSRILIPDEDPGIPIPLEWKAEAREDQDYIVLGPSLKIDILGQSQPAHINYHPRLGHYLLQPLAMNMEGYGSADEVFESWNHVIKKRDENMAKMQRECPMQREVSRREFFGRKKQEE